MHTHGYTLIHPKSIKLNSWFLLYKVSMASLNCLQNMSNTDTVIFKNFSFISICYIFWCNVVLYKKIHILGLLYKWCLLVIWKWYLFLIILLLVHFCLKIIVHLCFLPVLVFLYLLLSFYVIFWYISCI